MIKRTFTRIKVTENYQYSTEDITIRDDPFRRTANSSYPFDLADGLNAIGLDGLEVATPHG